LTAERSSAHGWTDATGTITTAKTTAAARRAGPREARRGTLGSRIAISRPSSCERCAIARLAPARTGGEAARPHHAGDVESWSA
jgi:hypothetical protein